MRGTSKGSAARASSADGVVRPGVARRYDPPPMMRCDLLVTHAAEVLTLRGPVPRVGSALNDLGIEPDGAVAIHDGRIVEVGSAEELASKYAPARTVDAGGGVVLPGFVDAHTHPVFAATREREFDMRLRGRTYQDITTAGGGIFSSVRSLRAASTSDLETGVRRHFDRFLDGGTTTIEAKSGYGLNLDDELRSLEILGRVAADHPLEVFPTFLGAHQMPEEFKTRRPQYIEFLRDVALPEVKRRRLARACDVFCDDGAFTVDEARAVLTAARDQGFQLRVHADELAQIGASALAAELAAASADHLCKATPAAIDALARAKTTAILLPATVLSLGVKATPPARALIDARVPVAIASDFNPGTSYTTSMPLVIALACCLLRLTVAESIAAATVNAAYSLELHDRVGRLEPGMAADLVVLDRPSHLFLGYELGASAVRAVVKNGRIVRDRA